jgi:hypothetical protein
LNVDNIMDILYINNKNKEFKIAINYYLLRMKYRNGNPLSYLHSPINTRKLREK